MKVQITLSPSELAECVIHAQKSVAYHKKRVGSYGHNKVDSNMVGVKGETASLKWLRSIVENSAAPAAAPDVKPNYVNISDKKNSDITFGGYNIEVKSLNICHWANLGRMIPPDQLPKYVAKNALVIWATATEKQDDPVVTLQGWNYAKDVQEKGEPRKTKCPNIWLKNEEDMRDMASLKLFFEEKTSSAVVKHQKTDSEVEPEENERPLKRQATTLEPLVGET